MKLLTYNHRPSLSPILFIFSFQWAELGIIFGTLHQMKPCSAFETPRAKCRYYEITICSTPKNIATYFGNFEKALLLICCFPQEQIAITSVNPTLTKKTEPKIDSQLRPLLIETHNIEQKTELDKKLTKQMNSTITSFSFFDNELCFLIRLVSEKY